MFQVVKTTIWLVIFLIVIIDTTTVSYPSAHSTIVSTTNSDGNVVGSEVNVASSSGIAVLLNGVVETSVVLYVYLVLLSCLETLLCIFFYIFPHASHQVLINSLDRVTFVGNLIYASVTYHRHRKARQQRGKHYAIPDQSDELRVYPVQTPPRRPSFYGFRTRPTSGDSTYRSSPFAERGLLGFQYPRNAWQQTAAYGAGGNAASPTSTTAPTHSSSIRTTTTAPPPRYESVAMDIRNTIFPSIHEVAGEEHLHEVSGDDPLHEVCGADHLPQERPPRAQELDQGQRQQRRDRTRSRGPRTPLLPPSSSVRGDLPAGNSAAEHDPSRKGGQQSYELSARKSTKSLLSSPADSPRVGPSSRPMSPVMGGGSSSRTRRGGTNTPTRLKGNQLSRATSRASSRHSLSNPRRWWR